MDQEQKPVLALRPARGDRGAYVVSATHRVVSSRHTVVHHAVERRHGPFRHRRDAGSVSDQITCREARLKPQFIKLLPLFFCKHWQKTQCLRTSFSKNTCLCSRSRSGRRVLNHFKPISFTVGNPQLSKTCKFGVHFSAVR